MNFRINQLKINYSDFFSLFSSFAEKIKPIAKINSRTIYDADFLISKSFEHSLGLLYIQSLSSMLPALILNPQPNEIVLDMCAAPGSKTTLLCELMENSGLIIANEISLDRVKTLSHNLDRIGALNSIILNKNGHYIDEAIHYQFDKILLDPPCSALGSFQDDSISRKNKNVERLDSLVEIQFKLLNKADKLLKKNGILVYSTCTTTLEENEYLIQKFIDKNAYEIIDIFNDINIDIYGYNLENNRLLPGTIRIDDSSFPSEKFFIAKLRKLNGEEDFYKRHDNYIDILTLEDATVLPILEHLSQIYGINLKLWQNYKYLLKSENLYAVRTAKSYYFNVPFQRLGMKIASFDAKTGWRLTTSAVQIFKEQISKNIINLKNKEELISYYNGQKIKTTDNDSDFIVVKYDNLFLGTGKIRNNILFSQYPKSRRMTDIDFSMLKS